MKPKLKNKDYKYSVSGDRNTAVAIRRSNETIKPDIREMKVKIEDSLSSIVVPLYIIIFLLFLLLIT